MFATVAPTKLLNTIPKIPVRIFTKTTNTPSTKFDVQLLFALTKLFVTTEGGVADMSDRINRLAKRTSEYKMNTKMNFSGFSPKNSYYL